MSKVFRLYKEGANTLEGWNESPSFPYNSTNRDTIEDPDGASAKHEITSIPSPFARIDLIKTAFKEVCKRASRNLAELDGKTIFHKMVSDALDVGEIFFNIDKFKDKIEIITWEHQTMLQALKNSGNVSHAYVADALEKFLLSDAKTYNFDQLKNVYLLNYKHGPHVLNLIGATSPATLFFSGANDLSYIKDIFFANNDKPFDGDYAPLFKRDVEYQKMWWTLRATIPNFAKLFPEIEHYLTLTYTAIPDVATKDMLRNVSATTSVDFSAIDVLSNQQTNQVEVIGYQLYKKGRKEHVESEFTIRPQRELSGKLPLVLPVESGNKYAELQYVSGTWGTSNKAPYREEQPSIESRALPFDGSVCPYLTISDFLEDTIVKVPHDLNETKFFDGNLRGKEKQTTFLLPLKPLYFEYFTIDTLQTTFPDGKRAFEMETLAGNCVNVVVRIPIKGNGRIEYIEYQRTYYAERSADVSAMKNDGGISVFDFTGFVMPCVKFQKKEDAYYTISCVSAFSKQFRFEFFEQGRAIRNVPVDCRNRERGILDFKAETYTLEQANFDFIRVADERGVGSVLIPKFATYQGIDDYEFAIDLGTSNTHIEMRKADSRLSESFQYNDTEGLLSTFFVPHKVELGGKLLEADLRAENELIATDFVPLSIGAETGFSFPTRTVLSYAKTTDWNANLRTWGLINFNLAYNKNERIAYNAKPLVNIKWSNEANAQTAMQAYIRNVLLLIRNKVVANNGSLERTKITWFYPHSMSPRRLASLEAAWTDAFNELFRPTSGAISKETESVAPIRYYFTRYATATNLINVDIGGGTTDVAFSSAGKVEAITSFKFAANSLFEDSFSPINPNNGIVDMFKENIRTLLESLDSNEGAKLLKTFEENMGQPANMASFLFSLKDNAATKSLAASKIDFNRILQNDTQFKIVFILFYTSIIYHTAQLVRVKDMKVPRHIAFSGNGSKIVSILSADVKIIAKYTKMIFEQVLGKEYGSELDILGLEQGGNPKEATCKGGLLSVGGNDSFETLTLQNSNGTLFAGNEEYASLSDDDKAKMVESVKAFLRFTLEKMPKVFNFDDHFGVDAETLDIAREECFKDLDTYLDKGIQLSIEEAGSANNVVNETLVFYPMKGLMQALSEKIRMSNL